MSAEVEGRTVRVTTTGEVFHCASPSQAHLLAGIITEAVFEALHAAAAPKPRRWGVLFRWGSCWVGAHWSPHNRRWCINLLPCVTLWITLEGGKAP